jgi:hypothetical protein
MIAKKTVRACLVLPFLLPTSSVQVCLIFVLWCTCVMGSKISAQRWGLPFFFVKGGLPFILVANWESSHPTASPQESISLCLKRKLVDDCVSKEYKSHRVQANNGLSSDSSAEHCNRAHPNLAIDCVNFLKSGVPSRIMYYKQGSWHNFSEQIMKALIEEFRGNKSSVVVVMDNEPFHVDFLSMTLVNLSNRNQRYVAWFDGTCKCFFPSKFFDEEIGDVVKGDAVNVESTAPGIMLDKGANSPHKMVKQVVQESCPPNPQKSCNTDILRKKNHICEKG